MSLQYISDSKGETTGVYIPIKEWNELKSRFKEMDIEDNSVPDWQKEIVKQRYEDFLNNPEQGLNFETALKDIEKEL